MIAPAEPDQEHTLHVDQSVPREQAFVALLVEILDLLPSRMHRIGGIAYLCSALHLLQRRTNCDTIIITIPPVGPVRVHADHQEHT